MKYQVVLKGYLKADDEAEVDTDSLADNLVDAIDNTDVDVDVDMDDDDEDDTTVTYALTVEDVELTPATD